MSDPVFTPNISSYNKPFWEGVSQGELRIQYCPNCDEYTYPPRVSCPECPSDLEWISAEGEGTIYSYGIVHHPDPPGIIDDDDLPIIGAVIELTEGPRMVTNIVNTTEDEIEVGDTVAVTFHPYGDLHIPQFEPIE